MKDIDTLLLQHPPKPHKALSPDFAAQVVSELQSRPAPHKLRSLWAALRAGSPRTVVGTTAIAGGGFISAVTAAIMLWPTPTVTPTMTKHLPSGGRIIGVHIKNCQLFTPMGYAPAGTGGKDAYYEVRKGSTLTNEQISNTLRAVCEEKIGNDAVSGVIKQLPQITSGLMTTVVYTITALHNESISVAPDPHYDLSAYTLKPVMTYTKFSSRLLTYDGSVKVAYRDFKVGDSIQMIVRDTSGTSTETPQNWNPLNHPETITILALVKVPPLTADPTTFYRSVAGDIVRTEPCTTNPAGFCRAYDFAE